MTKKDTKARVPKTKVKVHPLSTSQRKAWGLLQQDLTQMRGITQQFFQVLQVKLINPLIVSTLEGFARELGIDPNDPGIDFDNEKLRFTIGPVKASDAKTAPTTTPAPPESVKEKKNV